MIFLILFLFCVISVVGLGILAGLSDFRGMTIPNLYSLLIVVAFFLAFGAAFLGESGVFQKLSSHIIAGLAVFLVTFLMHMTKMIGGGDAKLLSAYSFWVGLSYLSILVFYMAVAGAVLGILALILKRAKPFKSPKEGSWIARVQEGQSVVPYGIPIVFGALVAFAMMDFAAPAMWATFMD